MSVLIRGMNIPKNCNSCLFDDGVHCMAYPRSEDLVYDISDGKPNWCPLVPVPPHGRLIDADALRELYEEWENDKAAGIDIDKCHVPTPVIRQNIDDAPTIIPAEECE